MKRLLQILRDYHGVLVTIAALVVLEILAWLGLRIPNPPIIYLTAVVYAAFQGGFPAGMLSTAITLVYALYFFSVPGQFLHFTDDNAMRVLVLVIFTPLMAIMVSVLKQRVTDYTHQLEAANQELLNMATTDTLTRLKNRRALLEILDREIRRAQRSLRPLSVLFLDVDWFKAYNDSFGHEAGDRALQRIGEILRQNSRTTDVIGRYGGEEFLAVLPESDRDEALEIAHRINIAIEAARWPLRPMTASIGVATLAGPRLHSSRDIGSARLIAEADQALYHSKEHGRNRVTHHDMVVAQARPRLVEKAGPRT